MVVGHPGAGLRRLLAALRTAIGSRAARSRAEWPTRINLGWTSTLRLVLPYLTVPIALWLVYSAVSSPNESGVADMHVVVSALAVLALVLVRQGITLRAYHRLGRSLAALSLELEDRVLARTQELKKGAEDLDRRTEELNALNRVARDLSRCATSQETLSVGVRAACDAVGMSAGAVWLAAPDGTTRLSTSHAVSQEAVPLVAELPNDVSDLVGAAAGNGVVVAGKGDREGNGRPSVALPWSPGVLVAAPLIARGTPPRSARGDRKRRARGRAVQA